MGCIRDDTPVMKFFHWTDQDNMNRYKRDMSQGGKGGKSTKTFV